jgi:hypothetical protein
MEVSDGLGKHPERSLTVMTVCSLILNGPVLKVQVSPNVLNTFIGTILVQRQPTGYTNLPKLANPVK